MIRCFSYIKSNIRYDVYLVCQNGEYYFHIYHDNGHGSVGFFNLFNYEKWSKYSKRRFISLLTH